MAHLVWGLTPTPIIVMPPKVARKALRDNRCGDLPRYSAYIKQLVKQQIPRQNNKNQLLYTGYISS